MITLGAQSSAFRPYFRPVMGEGQSPTDKIAPLIAELCVGATPELVAAAVANLTALSPTLPTQIMDTVAPATMSSINETTPTGAGGKAKRKRTTFTSSQAAILEKEYELDQYMPRSRRLTVADSLQLSENQIKTWFQNRRAKDKKSRCLTTTLNNALAMTPPMPTVSGPSAVHPHIQTSPFSSIGDSAHSPCPSSTDSTSATPPLTYLTPPTETPTTAAPPSLLELLAMGGPHDLLSYGLLNEQLLKSLADLQSSNRALEAPKLSS